MPVGEFQQAEAFSETTLGRQNMIDTIGTIVLWGIPVLAGVLIILDNNTNQASMKKK